MELKIQITDHSDELRYKAERQINIMVEQLVNERMKTIDFDAVIAKRVEYLVDNSKYVANHVIKNLVQQKIARELAKSILNPDKTK